MKYNKVIRIRSGEGGLSVAALYPTTPPPKATLTDTF